MQKIYSTRCMQEKPHVVLCPIYSCGAFDATRVLAWAVPGGRQIDQILIFSQINSHIFASGLVAFGYFHTHISIHLDVLAFLLCTYIILEFC